MSAANTPLEIDDAPAPATKKLEGKTVLIAVVVLAALAYRTWFSGDDKPKAPASSVEAPANPAAAPRSNAAIIQATKQQEQQDVTSLEMMGDLDITGPTSKGALLKLKNNLDLTTERMNQVIQNLNTMQTRQENFEKQLVGRLDTKMSELTQIITQLSSNRAYQLSREGVSEEKELILPAGEGQSLGDGLDAAFAEPAKKKFGYESFTVAPVDGERTETTGALQNILGGGAQKKPSTTQPAPQEKPAETNTIRSIVGSSKEVVSRYDTLEIGKGSFARAKLLHGIDCPVGGTGVVTDLFSHVPVTAIVTGKFIGPNGDVVDIGHAEFQGVCVGQRTTERARIKIESLSYVDEEGKQQDISVNGYINDGSDNSIDVPGFLISTRTDDLIKTASLAGLSTMAAALSGAQFTQTASAAAGTSTSTMTGDVGTSVAASGLAGVLERVATLTAAELEASVDIIRVSAGREIIFYSLEPIKVDVLKDNYEETTDELS